MRTSKLCWESTYSDYILCGKKYRYFGRFFNTILKIYKEWNWKCKLLIKNNLILNSYWRSVSINVRLMAQIYTLFFNVQNIFIERYFCYIAI